MKIIEDNYIFTERAKEEADKNYEECNSKLISITSKGKELYKRKEEEKKATFLTTLRSLQIRIVLPRQLPKTKTISPNRTFTKNHLFFS